MNKTIKIVVWAVYMTIFLTIGTLAAIDYGLNLHTPIFVSDVNMNDRNRILKYFYSTVLLIPSSLIALIFISLVNIRKRYEIWLCIFIFIIIICYNFQVYSLFSRIGKNNLTDLLGPDNILYLFYRDVFAISCLIFGLILLKCVFILIETTKK